MSNYCPRCGALPPFGPVGCAHCGLPFGAQAPAPVPPPLAAAPLQYAGQPPPPSNPYQQPSYAPPQHGWPTPNTYGYGFPQAPRPRDRGMEALLPVNRSGYAIAAGYLALFSILIIPGPFALGFGILAMRDLRDKPQVGGRGRAIFGIVTGGLVSLLIVWGLIGAVVNG